MQKIRYLVLTGNSWGLSPTARGACTVASLHAKHPLSEEHTRGLFRVTGPNADTTKVSPDGYILVNEATDTIEGLGTYNSDRTRDMLSGEFIPSVAKRDERPN